MKLSVHTLAAFLERTGLLDRFRSDVAPHLKYLRSVMGDGFFTDAPPEKGFRSQGGGPIELRTEEYAGYSPEMTGDAPAFDSDWEVSEIEEDPNCEWRTKERSFHRLEAHFSRLEEILLGSMRAGGVVAAMKGEDYQVSSGKEITPFPSLLGSDQVKLGKGGTAGGFRGLGELPLYSSPYEGKVDFLSMEKVDGALEELAAGGVVPGRDLIMLVGWKLLQVPFEPIPWDHAGEEPLFSRRYNGNLDLDLRPKIAWSRFMPHNAIYLINPKKVFIHAPRICWVKAREEDNMLTSTRSYLAHSLLRSIDQSGSENMERYHRAFLGVKPTKPLSPLRQIPISGT